MAGASHLVFAAGSAWYAVPAHCAWEIVTLGELTPVPNAARHLLGVFAHRGEVIPLIGLEELRGGQSTERARAVLVRAGRGTYAVTASKVLGVHALEGEAGPLASEGLGFHLRGPFRAGGREVLAIDPDGLCAFLSEPRAV